MPAYTVFPVELHASSDHLGRYKMLRLASLQIDPGAFSSNYAREVAFSDNVWRERLDSTVKRTFVASAAIDNADDGAPHEDVFEGQEGKDVKEEWIGTARIIGPTGMGPFLEPFREAGVGAEWQLYGLSAMWVHPAHRNRGVGAQLVKACLEWARTNIDTNFSSKNCKPFEKTVVLLVYDDNIAGRTLYRRMGFTDLEEVSADDGERWMCVKL